VKIARQRTAAPTERRGGHTPQDVVRTVLWTSTHSPTLYLPPSATRIWMGPVGDSTIRTPPGFTPMMRPVTTA